MVKATIKNIAEKNKAFLGVIIFSGALQGVCILVQAYLLSVVINRAYFEEQTIYDLRFILLWMLLTIFFRALFYTSQEYFSKEFAIRVKSNYRTLVFRKLVEIGPVGLKKERTGELVNTAFEGVESLDPFFAKYLPQIFIATIVPIGVILIVFPLDWISALVFMLTAPLIPMFMFLIGRMAENKTKRQWKLMSVLSAHFLDILQGLTTLKILGQSRQQIKGIKDVSLKYADATMSVLRVAFLSALTLELLVTISTAIIAVQVGLRLLYGQILFQRALFVLIIAPEFYLPLRGLGTHFHDGMMGMQSLSRISDLFREKSLDSGRVKINNFELLEFSNVSYQYPDVKIPALKKISFEINRGEQVAVVGKSGSGKSTIANLLLGFIQSQNGSIRVNGVEISELDISFWREQISWVSQSPFLFMGTIASNLKLAKPDATAKEMRISLEKANLFPFVMELEDGMDTPIGERGIQLSRGQGQRLALARAFLKGGSFLILDEPTSSLDVFSEREIVSLLEDLKKQRTCLIIAHRFPTVKNADRIIFLDDGEIVAVGDHSDLLENCSSYAEFFPSYGGNP